MSKAVISTMWRIATLLFDGWGQLMAVLLCDVSGCRCRLPFSPTTALLDDIN